VRRPTTASRSRASVRSDVHPGTLPSMRLIRGREPQVSAPSYPVVRAMPLPLFTPGGSTKGYPPRDSVFIA
jgi:hypothetical protein